MKVPLGEFPRNKDNALFWKIVSFVNFGGDTIYKVHQHVKFKCFFDSYTLIYLSINKKFKVFSFDSITLWRLLICPLLANTESSIRVFWLPDLQSCDARATREVLPDYRKLQYLEHNQQMLSWTSNESPIRKSLEAMRWQSFIK